MRTELAWGRLGMRSASTLGILVLAVLWWGAVASGQTEEDYNVPYTNLVVKEEHRGRLQELLLSPDLWAMERDVICHQVHGLYFCWVSEEKTAIRSSVRGLELFGRPVYEVVIKFTSNGVREVNVSFFNRGDTGNIFEEDFLRLGRAVDDALTRLCGHKGRQLTQRRVNTLERKAWSTVWTNATTLFRLDSAYSFRKQEGAARKVIIPDYLNMTMLPNRGQTDREVAGEEKIRAGGFTLKKRIKKEPNGDVYLTDLPMVDQGQKGYCAVASVERVMRYYGVDIDQYQLAQMSETDAWAGGTNPDLLLKALRTMANYMNARVEVIEKMDKDWFRVMIEDYNRTARKMRRREIVLPTHGQITLASNVFPQMENDVYIQANSRSPVEVQLFAKNIKNKIDQGYPVLWSLWCGFVTEEKVIEYDDRAGHMRVIFGYNMQSNYVIYTDSWGPGHEFKRMNFRDARAVTTGLFTIEPR